MLKSLGEIVRGQNIYTISMYPPQLTFTKGQKIPLKQGSLPEINHHPPPARCEIKANITNRMSRERHMITYIAGVCNWNLITRK